MVFLSDLQCIEGWHGVIPQYQTLSQFPHLRLHHFPLLSSTLNFDQNLYVTKTIEIV